jgi:hypothetical protein
MFKDFEIAEKGDEIYLCAFMEYKNYAGQFYVTDQKGRAVLVDSSSKNQNLIQALVCSSNGYRALQSGQCHSIKALAEYLNCDRSYMSKILKCAFLSPKIKEAILDGRQPANMTVQKLIKISEHALWDVQERKFGIHA